MPCSHALGARLAAATSACTTVQPWERDLHARADMQPERARRRDRRPHLLQQGSLQRRPRLRRRRLRMQLKKADRRLARGRDLRPARRAAVRARRRAGSGRLGHRHLAPLLRRERRPRDRRQPRRRRPPRARRGPRLQPQPDDRLADRRDAERRRAGELRCRRSPAPPAATSYTVQPGELPLDPTFLDTRIALSGGWQQSLGESSRWNVGFSTSQRVRLPPPRREYALRARLQPQEHDRLRRSRLRAGRHRAGRRRADRLFADDGRAPRTRTRATTTSAAGATSRRTSSTRSSASRSSSAGATSSSVSYSYGQSDGYLTDPYKILSVVDPVTGVPVAGPMRRHAVPLPVGASAGLAHQAERLRRMAPRLRPRLAGAQRALHDRRLGRRLADDRDALSLEHQRALATSSRTCAGTRRARPTSTAPCCSTAIALPEFASADQRLADFDAYTVGAKYGRRTDYGEFSLRLEYYRQEGDPSPGSAVGDLAGFELLPPLTAYIVQFGYKFRL